MQTILVACSDLMTQSRLSLADVADAQSWRLIAARSEAVVRTHLIDEELAVVLVDLQTFGDMLPEIAAERTAKQRHWRLIGFAPHVAVEALAAAEPLCDRVMPRGSVIKRFATLCVQNDDATIEQ